MNPVHLGKGPLWEGFRMAHSRREEADSKRAALGSRAPPPCRGAPFFPPSLLPPLAQNGYLFTSPVGKKRTPGLPFPPGMVERRLIFLKVSLGANKMVAKPWLVGLSCIVVPCIGRSWVQFLCQGTYPGCRWDPCQGAYRKQSIDVSLSH